MSQLGEGYRPVSVFSGTAPLPTFGLQGTVHEGATPNESRVDGATIEVIDGLIAGRRATSGTRPDVVPGYFAPGPAAPGLFIINGVPPGTIRLRVTKDGYISEERDVTFTHFGQIGSATNFQLRRQ